MKTRQIIWTTDDYFDESAMNDWAEGMMEINGWESPLSEEEKFRLWCEEVNDRLQDERENLNVPITDGYVVAIGDLGLWNGRVLGLGRRLWGNLNDILQTDRDTEYATFYCDGYNVRSELTHHDGTNRLLYRLIRSESDYNALHEKMLWGKLTMEEFVRKTESLYPLVANVYGWDIRNAQQRKRARRQRDGNERNGRTF